MLLVLPIMALFWALALWKVRKAVATSPFAGLSPVQTGPGEL